MLLRCTSTGGVVNASPKSAAKLLKNGFVPFEDEQPKPELEQAPEPAPEKPKAAPKRRKKTAE